MRKRIRRAAALLLTLLLLLPAYQTQAFGASETSETDELLTAAITDTVEWCRSDGGKVFTDAFLQSLGQSSLSDWLAFDMGRLGVEEDYDAALEALEAYVTQAYQNERLLDANKSTEWHRIALTVLALGGDPTSFGTDVLGKPINLIADGVYNRGYVTSLGAQGVNGWIWGLITLDAMRYEIPEGSYYSREDIISEILAAQGEDGAFCFMPGAPDVDITAMALQALAPYWQSDLNVPVKQGEETVQRSVSDAVEAALAWLSGSQLESGGYSYYGTENAESTAQVIVALCSLKLDPLGDTRFIKGEHTLLNALLGFRQESGGFVHSLDGSGEDLMATGQSLYALCALYRQRNGYRVLYDLRPEEEAMESYVSGPGTVTELLPRLNRKSLRGSALVGGLVGIGIVSVILTIILLYRRKKRKEAWASMGDAW